MATTLQVFTMNATLGQKVQTAWIDVSTYKRVRLQVEQLPDSSGGIDYRANIDVGTFDPAQTTPEIQYGTTYMCGIYVPQTDIFDLTEHLGVKQIKLAYENVYNAPTCKLYLICES